MAIDTLAAFVDVLRQSRLLEADQLAEMARTIQPRFPEPRALANHLIQLGWLTPYQINQIFQGQAASLVFGQYRILERIGEGGMGQVFKARHHAMGRIVALKVIRKDRLGNTEAIKRFHREMTVVAKLSHPNVVIAFDADATAGMHYFAMEYVEGPDLGRVLKEQGPLPVALACDCIRQAALGLQHAHEKGLVHRDIKPSNLMLTRTGEANGMAGRGSPSGKRLGKPVVKILDMGLARIELEEGDETTQLSQDGKVLGTPDFMAPEQAKNSRSVDARADVYSLGCTFYYLLTRQPPFTGGTNIEKLLKHQMDTPRPIEQLRPDVPEGVRQVLRRMLAKRPEDRIQTAGDVAAALAPYCDEGSAAFTARLPVAGVVPAHEALTTPPGSAAATVATATSTRSRLRRPVAEPSAPVRARGFRPKMWQIAALAGVALFFLVGLVVAVSLLSGSTPKTVAALASNKATVPSTERRPPTSERKLPALEPVQKYLFPDAAFVISINIAQIHKSDVYKRNDEKFKELLGPLGFDSDSFADPLFSELERITMAMPYDDTKKFEIIFQGNFETKKFRDYVRKTGAKPLPMKDAGTAEAYEYRDPANRENRWAYALINPGVFVVSPTAQYVAMSIRRSQQANPVPLRDVEVQSGMDKLDPRKSVSIVVGGSLRVTVPMGRTGPMSEIYHIRSIRAGFQFADDLRMEAIFKAMDAEAVETVMFFPQGLKLGIMTGSRDLGMLVEKAIPEKNIVKGPNNTVVTTGQMSSETVGKALEILRGR
ncbi:MAG: serine/threonine protein kinase [Gemmataceae bacterium]|nr:serine/threonine protein kinase [Gemmataceae bacterium]